MARVVLTGVSKIWQDGTHAVADLSLTVEDGDLMVLVGPSGCGKTTTLRLTAGLEDPSEGEIRIGERVVNSLGPRERDVAMVFQNYALYPNMTVFDNLAFPLRARRLPKEAIRHRVERVAALLEIESILKRKPRALSGGQRQRVAMGRAIVREPQVFLMDEPLSNLDATLRTELRAEIVALQRELGVTTMYVTHDQVEAMAMGTRIAVLRAGLLEQEGTPQHLYDMPTNLFVATFLGSPKMNVLRGRIDGNAAYCVLAGSAQLPIEEDGSRALGRYAGAEVAVGIRPEHLADPADGPPSRPRLRGRVRLVELLGAEQLVHLEVSAVPVPGATADTASLTARFDARKRVRPGDAIDVAVAAERLHFFDLETGRAIRRPT